MLVESRQWALVDTEESEVVEIYGPSNGPLEGDESSDHLNDISPGVYRIKEVTITWNT